MPRSPTLDGGRWGVAIGLETHRQVWGSGARPVVWLHQEREAPWAGECEPGEPGDSASPQRAGLALRVGGDRSRWPYPMRIAQLP